MRKVRSFVPYPPSCPPSTFIRWEEGCTGVRKEREWERERDRSWSGRIIDKEIVERGREGKRNGRERKRGREKEEE